jgi:hypothetical protein
MITTYSINADDIIVHTGADWDYFADANGAPELLHQDVIGRSIFSYFADERPVRFWKDIFNEVRLRQEDLTLNFRCDSPEAQRLFAMDIRIGKDNHLHITTRQLQTIPQDVLLRPVYACLNMKPQTIRCAQCNRVKWQETWVEAYDAIKSGLVIDEFGRFSVLYTICEDCKTTKGTHLVGSLLRK